jgi:hypothetical protein
VRYNALLRKHQRASVVVSERFGTVFMVDGLGKGTATLEGARAFAAAAPPRTEGETDMRSKYPNISVALIGEDENAFAILERVQRALREAGVPAEDIKAFTLEVARATSTTCWRPSCGR